ncbi:MAG TPA: HAMP domain-containing methyl-accepting chemotaxis protein [Solirubrobacteraceae bacterium]|nr:HAMP domain-containing methyl-accepting chemotaxis protein [Solirubrobacteraceae bacterium]
MPRRFTVSIRSKLLASFGVVVALMLVLGLSAIAMLGTENGHVGQVAGKVVPATQAVGDAAAIMNKYRKDQLHYILASPADRAGAQGVSGDLAGDLSDMSALLASYRSHHLVADATDARLLAGFQSAFATYVAKSGGFRPLADQGLLVAAGAVVGSGPGDDAYNKLKAASQAWSDYKVKVASAASAASRSSYQTGRTLIIVLLLLAVGIAAGIAILISRGLSRAVGQVGAAAEAIARGEVDQHIEIRSRDELGAVAADVQEMIAYLRHTASVAEAIAEGDLTREHQPRSEKDALGLALASMTAQLRALVGEINDATGRMSSSSQEMARTSQETGRSVDEVAAALGNVAQGTERQVISIENARRVADRVASDAGSGAEIAYETAGAVERARELAAGGADAVTRATEAMRAVKESSAAVTAAIAQLGSKSDQIGGIVRTIGGIAEQTNLLALNAAIEAARAGESGRGFAVVAEEVRKLAEESQAAAGSIAELIAEIQAETASTVAVVDAGAQRTEDGVRIVDEAREAFLVLGESVTEMSGRIDAIGDVVRRIASSAQEVHASMADVANLAQESSAATEQVSASSQETSAAAQQIAASASDLADTAGELSGLVGRFRLPR